MHLQQSVKRCCINSRSSLSPATPSRQTCAWSAEPHLVSLRKFRCHQSSRWSALWLQWPRIASRWFASGLWATTRAALLLVSTRIWRCKYSVRKCSCTWRCPSVIHSAVRVNNSSSPRNCLTLRLLFDPSQICLTRHPSAFRWDILAEWFIHCF